VSDHGTWSEPAAPWTEEEGPGGSHVVAILMASVAALGGFLFGYDTAVINGAVAAIDERFNASNAALGLTVSSALVGSALGALIAGRVADWSSRPRTSPRSRPPGCAAGWAPCSSWRS
jgi:MFS transporter, SP family, sugar:H+ symporter